MKKMGVIAGNRQLPLILSRNLKKQGYQVIIVAHRGETQPGIVNVSDKLLWINIGQVGKIIKYFQTNNVKEICIVGGVNKGVMFTRARPDRHALKVLLKLKAKGDDNILRAFAGLLEDKGFSVINPLPFLDELLANPGCLTKRRPNARENGDIQIGAELLRKIGDLDIGQALIVKEGVILAIEAMEGTDEMIRR